MCVFQKSKEEITTTGESRYLTSNSHNGVKSSQAKTNSTVISSGGEMVGGGGGGGGGGPLTVSDLKFSVKLNELKDLMQLKGTDAANRLNTSHGGLEGLAAKLGTSLLTGLDDSPPSIEKRVNVYGRNEIPPKAPKSIFRLALEALQDTTLVMLMICSVISIGLSFYHPAEEKKDEEFMLVKSKDLGNLEWVEGAAIMVAVVVVVFVTAFNDWRKEKQFRGLKSKIESNHLASVIRNGQVKQINVKDLVVGDICCIKYGDLIPADGVVTNSSDLKIDESSLTGETDLIKKNNVDNLTLLSGTHVMEGSGQFLVLAVGIHSQTGIIMTLLGATADQDDLSNDESDKKKTKKNSKKNANKITPEEESEEEKGSTAKTKKSSQKKHRSVLQIKLGKLAVQIGYGGMLGALFTFLILIFRMAIEEFAVHQRSWSNLYIKYIISYLIQAITVIVVAVPEGLPLAVTLALAFAVRQMTKDNNLVRHLDACETMGNATTICSDKTGTLTTNRMTAVQCWISDSFYKKIPEKSQIKEEVRNLIYESISVNTNYTSNVEVAKQLGEMPKQVGNKTECGLLGFVVDLGGDYAQVRNDFPTEQFAKVYTFNSARKMMSTIIKNQHMAGYRLHTKGASEIVLNKCSHYLNSDGKSVKLSKQKIDELIKHVVEQMACDGLRTICVAYRDFIPSNEAKSDQDSSASGVVYFDQTPDWDDEPQIIKDLTCICLIGIEDPVRAEVPDAIRKCQTSGVVVRMVTGDNINTATSIAMKCGIIKPGDDFLILESKDFNKRIRDSKGEVQQHLLDQVWPKLRVLARSSPQDKYILVNGIVESKSSKNREVVAVTGDGTNDGPALKRADVGFAMGIQGTDVAKEASDIILTDDNFSSIVKAMMWGRNVYDAIAKFLQFQLTANFAAGIFSVVCAATIQAVPLKAVQMLWVNLVMDTLASLALATEPPTPDLLERKPYGRDKSILSITMIRNIFFHAVYQLIVLFALVWNIEDWMQVDSIIKYHDITKLKEPSLHFTIIFNAFVLMTLFNELNARKIHNERNVLAGIHKNLVFLVIWVGCFIGQILIVNYGGIVFAVESIDLDHWMWCLFLGFGSLIWGQIVTSIPVSFVKKAIRPFMCLKRRRKKMKEAAGESLKQTDEDEDDDEVGDADLEKHLDEDKETIEKSKVLWLRGANRIQNQIKVVEAFQQNLDDVVDTCNTYGSMASLRARPV